MLSSTHARTKSAPRRPHQSARANQSERGFHPGISLTAPIRPTREGWPFRLIPQRARRFFYTSPVAILDPHCSPEDYRRAMFAIYVGGTIKITWAGRQTEIDTLLIDHVDLTDATIVDMGASDGSTSRDLALAVTDEFRSFAITDRFLELDWTHYRGRHYFFDADRCVLIAGHRLLVWPQLSPAVASLYAASIRRAGALPRQTVQLINPEVRELIRLDPRISCGCHDIFRRWPGPPVDVVKTANVLRRLYFSDAEISNGLGAIHASLVPGGHLLLSDNSRRGGGSLAGALYRSTAMGFERLVSTQRLPDIDDLVVALRVPAVGSATVPPH